MCGRVDGCFHGNAQNSTVKTPKFVRESVFEQMLLVLAMYVEKIGSIVPPTVFQRSSPPHLVGPRRTKKPIGPVPANLQEVGHFECGSFQAVFEDFTPDQA